MQTNTRGVWSLARAAGSGALVVAALVFPCGSSRAQQADGGAAVTPLAGICYSPFRTNQNPDCGVLPTEAEIRQDVAFIKRAQVARRVRTYSCSGSLSSIPAICREEGLECWPGAWLGRFSGANQREVDALVAVGRQRLDNCPVLIVGNEVLLRQDMSEKDLLTTIDRVKRETDLPVAYADVGQVWLEHPAVIAAVDVVLAHIYPYWEGQPIADAAGVLVQSWQALHRACGGKRLVIGETGWPAADGRQGRAVASGANQARYLAEFLAASTARNIDYFWFALFSEPWKAEQEGQAGATWGLFAADGTTGPHVTALLPATARAGLRRSPGELPLPVALSLPAFVYREGESDHNRFHPTNWMGDVEALALDEHCRTQPRSGAECMRIAFTAHHGAGWAGIYWVGPYLNHWGDYPGYTLEGARKVVFWARGEKGGEEAEFKIGGMASPGKPFRDSFGPLTAAQARTKLGTKWTMYAIDLDNADATSLLGGFCAVVNDSGNPAGCTFYLDDIAIVADVIPPPLPAAPAVASPTGATAMAAVPQAIRAAQLGAVRESWGTDSAACFTDADLAEFQRTNGAQKVAAQVMSTPEVRAAVRELATLPAAERQKLLAAWKRSARKTWAELGRITSEGQTNAGQRAELDIADAVVTAIATQVAEGQTQTGPNAR